MRLPRPFHKHLNLALIEPWSTLRAKQRFLYTHEGRCTQVVPRARCIAFVFRLPPALEEGLEADMEIAELPILASLAVHKRSGSRSLCSQTARAYAGAAGTEQGLSLIGG